MRIEHSLPPGFLGRRPIRVLVVGAGGTGSAILMGLPYLDQAMRVWGHPYGLQVSIMDADTVSETNCVRQPFSASDIGQNKATVLINRINMFWGTQWSAEPCFFNECTLRRSYDEVPDLLIGCVDARAARKAIDQTVTRPMHATSYWLDIGNNAASGQYILGQPLNSRNRRAAVRLRTVSELYPEIVDAAAGDCAEGNSHALTCSPDSNGDRLTCGHRMRECRSLLCSRVLESDGLDRTAEKCVPLVQLIERGVHESPIGPCVATHAVDNHQACCFRNDGRRHDRK